ncbi:MAG: PAS domain S-box protein [Verrucomicrobia bacterium]|nr:PAS domain S-box protein [Verrucomicrobiota bacterium]
MTHLELRRHLVQLSRIFEDQRRAEDALRTTEAFFQALVESLPQRIIRKDTEGRFTFASRNFCAELRRPLEEIRGRTDYDFFPAELARKYHDDDQRVMAARAPFETVEEHLRPDGSKGFVQVVKTPLVDPRGHVVGVQGIFWDVTEQRQTEQALAHERDLLRALLDHIPDRIFFKDSQSRFIRCSASMFSSLGFKHPDEVIGKTDFDYYPRELAGPYFAEEQSIIETGQPLINKVQRHGNSEDDEAWSSVTKVPIYNHRGLITGIVGLSRDITKLKQAERALRQAEEKYRNIVENSVEGIFQTTPEGKYLSANRALAEMYGYSSAETLVGAMTDIQHQLYVDPNRREEFSRLMRENGEVKGFESQIRKRTGEVIWISESARSVCDARGVLQYYEGSVEDITARKLAEQAREAATQEALESARVKVQFLANMSHEFRTPLNAIIGNVSVLLAGRLGAEQRELLEPICDSAEALNRLINDILDFSKIEAGKLVLEQIDFDLRDAVEGTAEMLAQAARSQGDELVCRIDSRVPGLLRGDPVRVRQVLMNLLSNAIKFTKRGEVALLVDRLDSGGSRARLRFEVCDTGIGIADSAKSIIFHSFTQADGSTTRKFGGTGLGLTISKEIVELMGGRIGFESAVGSGSTFWFEADFDTPVSPAGPGIAPHPALAGRRALIVESQARAAEALVHYAKALGVEATLASSAESARARLLEATADGVAFDWMLVNTEMPEMDGVAFLQSVRKSPPLEGAKSVAVSSWGSRLDPAAMRAQGVAACLVKPIKARRFAEVLEAALKSDPGLMGGRAGDLADQAFVPPVFPSTTRILLAEDNPVNQQVALRMLRSLGLTAEVAGNGREVLEALQREPYDLVLLDCQMPEMDGYETARRIAELQAHPSCPLRSKPVLIAVTANAMSGDREKCLAAGMHEYLSKPMKLISLSQALERTLPGRAANGPPPAESGDAASASVAGREEMDVSVLQGLRELREPGQPDPLAQLVELFLRDSAPRLAVIEEGLSTGQAAPVIAAAHSLKGSASNLGARHLSSLSGLIEKHSKAGDLAAAKTVLEPLEREFERVRQFLRMEVQR